MVSYELAMGFALVSVLMAAQSLNLGEIVRMQQGNYGLLNWFWIPLFPIFLVYLISGVAETNRAPFDVAEGESEIVAGFHVEYSGMAFAVFFLAEYTNIFIVSAIAATFFLGGYQGPVLPGIVWFLMKSYLLVFVIIWFRWTYPRVRFDQLLNVAWKVLIPAAFLNLIITGGILKI